MKLPTIPPGLAGKIVNKTPVLGTNQIAGFAGFRPLATLEKNIIIIVLIGHLRDEVCFTTETRSISSVQVSFIFKFGNPSEV